MAYLKVTKRVDPKSSHHNKFKKIGGNYIGDGS